MGLLGPNPHPHCVGVRERTLEISTSVRVMPGRVEDDSDTICECLALPLLAHYFPSFGSLHMKGIVLLPLRCDKRVDRCKRCVFFHSGPFDCSSDQDLTALPDIAKMVLGDCGWFDIGDATVLRRTYLRISPCSTK
jgi:hypothetical protein